MKIPSLTEYQEACLLADYLDILETQGKIQRYSHIPNETFTKNWGTKVKNKKMGVRRGVPDYIVVMRNKVLFIELKRTTGSSTSDEQYKWQSALNDAGCISEICMGFEAAKAVIDDNI